MKQVLCAKKNRGQTGNTRECANLDVDVHLLLFEVQNDHLASGATNKQHLGGATENDLLDSQLRVVAERIVYANLSHATDNDSYAAGGIAGCGVNREKFRMVCIPHFWVDSRFGVYSFFFWLLLDRGIVPQIFHSRFHIVLCICIMYIDCL